ncbi:unnamed protein product [Amoebophrya sp. A120]|nr:unnamed protein product [Amoebophrya sp. A120]|eukprot:GSA120T00025639001.1
MEEAKWTRWYWGVDQHGVHFRLLDYVETVQKKPPPKFVKVFREGAGGGRVMHELTLKEFQASTFLGAATPDAVPAGSALRDVTNKQLEKEGALLVPPLDWARGAHGKQQDGTIFLFLDSSTNLGEPEDEVVIATETGNEMVATRIILEESTIISPTAAEIPTDSRLQRADWNQYRMTEEAKKKRAQVKQDREKSLKPEKDAAGLRLKVTTDRGDAGITEARLYPCCASCSTPLYNYHDNWTVSAAGEIICRECSRQQPQRPATRHAGHLTVDVFKQKAREEQVRASKYVPAKRFGKKTRTQQHSSRKLFSVYDTKWHLGRSLKVELCAVADLAAGTFQLAARKYLPQEASSAVREAFEKEAKILQKLQGQPHDNVLAVLDLEGSSILCAALVPAVVGLPEGTGAGQLLKFNKDGLRALFHLEAVGYAHRDLKLQNVGYGRGFPSTLHFVLMDMGEAKEVAELLAKRDENKEDRAKKISERAIIADFPSVPPEQGGFYIMNMEIEAIYKREKKQDPKRGVIVEHPKKLFRSLYTKSFAAYEKSSPIIEDAWGLGVVGASLAVPSFAQGPVADRVRGVLGDAKHIRGTAIDYVLPFFPLPQGGALVLDASSGDHMTFRLRDVAQAKPPAGEGVKRPASAGAAGRLKKHKSGDSTASSAGSPDLPAFHVGFGPAVSSSSPASSPTEPITAPLMGGGSSSSSSSSAAASPASTSSSSASSSSSSASSSSALANPAAANVFALEKQEEPLRGGKKMAKAMKARPKKLPSLEIDPNGDDEERGLQGSKSDNLLHEGGGFNIFGKKNSGKEVLMVDEEQPQPVGGPVLQRDDKDKKFLNSDNKKRNKLERHGANEEAGQYESKPVVDVVEQQQQADGAREEKQQADDEKEKERKLAEQLAILEARKEQVAILDKELEALWMDYGVSLRAYNIYARSREVPDNSTGPNRVLQYWRLLSNLLPEKERNGDRIGEQGLPALAPEPRALTTDDTENRIPTKDETELVDFLNGLLSIDPVKRGAFVDKWRKELA